MSNLPQYLEKNTERLRSDRILILLEIARKKLSVQKPTSPSSIRSFKDIMIKEARALFYSVNKFENADLGECAAGIALKEIGLA